MLVFRQQILSTLLAKLGYFSFEIYLLHVFATAGSRIVLHRLGVGNVFFIFLVSLCLGLGFPVVLELTTGQVPWISRLVFGQNPSLKQSPVRPNNAPSNPALESQKERAALRRRAV